MPTFDLDRFLAGKPLAITESGLEELRAHVYARIALKEAGGPTPALVAMAAEINERSKPTKKTTGAAGIIQIRGTIAQHAAGDVSSAMAGGAATETIAQQLDNALADDEIEKIILDIDSPGGSSYGVAELFDRIYSARGQKPIIAVANSLAASAAYWIGCAADRFYVTPGGVVGSIGVYSVHQDVSKMAENLGVKTSLIYAGKHKVEGNPYEPLGDDARASIQERVNEVYGQFVADVARGRGVKASEVRDGFGEGDVFGAKRATAERMADGVMTLEQAINHRFVIRRPASSGAGAQASSEIEAPDLEGDDDKEAPPTQEPQPNDDEATTARLDRMRLRSFEAAAI